MRMVADLWRHTFTDVRCVLRTTDNRRKQCICLAVVNVLRFQPHSLTTTRGIIGSPEMGGTELAGQCAGARDPLHDGTDTVSMRATVMSFAQPRVLILGIRGIPAAHGGFESFAEKLALFLVKRHW